MPESGTLHAEVPSEPQPSVPAAEAADIVVGISTYNSAAGIAHAVQTALAALREHFAARQSIVVHSDGGSQDGTVELARDAARGLDVPLLQVRYSLPPLASPAPELPGQGSAYRSIFEEAQKLRAKVCVVLDSSCLSSRPQWIDLLARPILERDFDLVAPYYARPKYEGAVTTGIVYPMVRALYGKRIRFPLGGDFAFSSRLMDHYLRQPVWNTELAWLGAHIWLSTQAVCSGFRVCQSSLGEKLRSSAEPAGEVSAILADVLGPLFSQVHQTVGVWQRVRGSEAVPLFGALASVATEPASPSAKRMMDAFRLGYQTLQEIWGMLLPPVTMLELKRLAGRPEESFRFAAELWARIVYDFALGYRMRVIGRDHLLRALTPLYLGWIASFILETENLPPPQMDPWQEKLCAAFEAQKPYFISRWRWPDRFNP